MFSLMQLIGNVSYFKNNFKSKLKTKLLKLFYYNINFYFHYLLELVKLNFFLFEK